ncbi:16S rRNA (uracil(1498)-N(3))-methyltransferase [Oceanobacillus saliphilus]|uniref:16S rRNA (uracil(1498)-N(3))-methyltransferase n=1 Tax=Oceanobacillus saliphilus TaxID=2925834 RepID=UPI003F684922
MCGLQRYFISSSNFSDNEVIITGDDVHHITRVMRNHIGDKIICNNDEGKAALCRISLIADNTVTAEIEAWLVESVEQPVNITIAQGIPKGDKFELILQKGTELGATCFIPYQAARSVSLWDDKKQAKKMKRFEKIVKEASEQSHRNKVPTIKKAMNLNALLNESKNYDVAIFAYEEQAKVAHYQSFGRIINELLPNQNLLVCIGPEGGFSENEADLLKESGFHPVRLGPRILRTETAALYVLASISYHFEELRCDECQQ